VGLRIPAPVETMGTGVYVVAITDGLDSTKEAVTACPLAEPALQELLDVRSELTLDGERPDPSTLGQRLSGFWCFDEVVVYIGLAGPRRKVKVSELSDRVMEYYSTRLGARSPHAGGWPLKTLKNLSDLYVHYAYCDDVEARERLMLNAFAERLSDETRSALYDAAQIMPFANLRDGQGRRKAQGIEGARAPRVRRRQRDPSRSGSAPSSRIDVARTSSTPTSAGQTQRITAGDIQRGILRIPTLAKGLFPLERAYVEIDLRGERASCRWDPRQGPDRERSGVLGVGIALARRHFAEGERLRIWADEGVHFLA
jgi:hypothetical protein